MHMFYVCSTLGFRLCFHSKEHLSHIKWLSRFDWVQLMQSDCFYICTQTPLTERAGLFMVRTTGTAAAADLGLRPPSIESGNNSISTDKDSWLWWRSVKFYSQICTDDWASCAVSYIPKQTLQELNSHPLHIWVTGLALTLLFMHLNMCKHHTHIGCYGCHHAHSHARTHTHTQTVHSLACMKA